MFNHLFANLQTRLSREEGQTMAEYGVVLAVITIACLVAFQTLGGNITDAIDAVSDILPS
jgi:Flp pilus assembly pilin Flp